MPTDGLAATAANGDRLATLEALRDRLATEIDTCDSKRDVAALSQRLMDVLAQIEMLRKPSEEKVTPLAEVLRLAGANSPRRPA